MDVTRLSCIVNTTISVTRNAGTSVWDGLMDPNVGERDALIVFGVG